MTPEEQKMLLRLILPHFDTGGQVSPDVGGGYGGNIGGPGYGRMAPTLPPTGNGSGPQGIAATQFGQNPYNTGIPLSNSFQAQTPSSNLEFNSGQYAPTMNKSAQNLGVLNNQLLQESQGRGPNPAQEQLKQATNRNMAQAYAMAQSSPNNAGAARNIANNVAAANQQAAADSAQMRMQQQLAAQSQLSQLGLGMYGTSGRLMTDSEKLQLEQAQGNQQAALNAQGLNAQISAANQQYGANVIGSGLNAAGAALAAGATNLGKTGSGWGNNNNSGNNNSGGGNTSGGGGGDTGGDVQSAQPIPDDSGAGDYSPPVDGGDTAYAAYGGLVPVRHYDDGGYVSPSASPSDAYNYTGKTFDYAGKKAFDYAGKSEVSDPKLSAGTTPYITPYKNGIPTGEAAKPKQTDISKVGGAIAKGGWQALGSIAGGPLGGMAAGALYNAFEPGGIFAFQGGGSVPGRAALGGNNLKNDTVPAMLSPGEIVLPRSVTQDADAAEKAKDFVLAIQKRKKKAA